MQSRKRDEAGAAMVEFALILPLLMMFVFGIIEFGRAYNAQVELTGAAREGARCLALDGDSGTCEGVLENAAPSIGSSVQIGTVATCSPGSTGDASITASYSLPFDIPFFNSGSFNLSATGVMRCGV